MQSSASVSPAHQHVNSSTQAAVDKGKRRALDSTPQEPASNAFDPEADDDEWCLICHTHPIVDRTFLPACLHSQFCFVCILRWIDIKRTCPLCLRPIGSFVIHSVRSDDDFLRYHLPPPPLVRPTTATSASSSRREITTRVQRARSARASQSDPLQPNVLAFRRFVYRNSLYAHHIGSNPRTGFSAVPTPARIRHDTKHATGEIAAKTSTFLRRELSLFQGVDVGFVTKYVVSLTQVWPLADDSMVKLVGEMLGDGGEGKARHLLHELECWLRSGRRELSRWDAVVQYGREGGERWDGLGRRVVGKKRARERGEDGVESEMDRRIREDGEYQPVEKRDRHGEDDGVESPSAGKEAPSGQRQLVEKRNRVEHMGLQEGTSSGDMTQTGLRAEVASRRSTLLDRLERERSLLYKPSS